MRIVKSAVAGTLESSDCLVAITPTDTEGVSFEIDSVVFNQYGDAIRKVAEDTAKGLGVTGASFRIQDRGAFDCVIAARVETAVMRASGGDAA